MKHSSGMTTLLFANKVDFWTEAIFDCMYVISMYIAI